MYSTLYSPVETKLFHNNFINTCVGKVLMWMEIQSAIDTIITYQ